MARWENETTLRRGTKNRIENYIEAITGDQFSIVITVKDKFNWGRANGLCVGLKFDDGSAIVDQENIVVAKEPILGLPSSISLMKLIDTGGFRGGLTFSLDNLVVRSNEGFQRVKLAFANVIIDNIKPTEKQKYDLSKQGKIVVSVQRTVISVNLRGSEYLPQAIGHPGRIPKLLA